MKKVTNKCPLGDKHQFGPVKELTRYCPCGFKMSLADAMLEWDDLHCRLKELLDCPQEFLERLAKEPDEPLG